MNAEFTSSRKLIIAAPPIVPSHEVSNYSDGTDALVFKRDDPTVKTKVGMDGHGSILVTSKRSGTITAKLMSTSPSNHVYAAILALMEGGPATFAPLIAQYLDTYRQDSVTGVFGVITQWPDLSRGDDIADQEWVIWTPRLDIFLGAPAFAGLQSAAAEAAF